MPKTQKEISMKKNFMIIILLVISVLSIYSTQPDLIYAHGKASSTEEGIYPTGPTCSKLSTAKWEDISLYDLTYGCMPAGWDVFFKTGDVREQISNISDAITHQVKQGYKIGPAIGNTFRALYLVKPDEVKTVIMGQDPAPQPGLATGLAFSTEPNVPSSKVASIQRVLLEAQNEGFCINLNNGDLKKWADGGVLLLNMALSIPCPPDEQSCTIGGHIALWGVFTDHLVNYIDNNAGAAAFILWGSKSGEYGKNVKNKAHKVLKGGHPSPRVSGANFFCKNYFNCTNKWLTANGRKPIDWKLKDTCSKSKPCIWAWHSGTGTSTCSKECSLKDCDVAKVPETATPLIVSRGGNDPEVVQCKKLDPPKQGVCSVTQGNDSILISGDILAPSKVYAGGDVLIKDGMITCVGCDCSSGLAEKPTKISCANGVVSPGLINAHDHITYNQNYPADWGTIRYDHRNVWRKGGDSGHPIIPANKGRDNQFPWSELRQVLSGTTSVAGSGGTKGLLRNLDKEELLEGLKAKKAFYSTFPLGDVDGVMHTNDCNYPKIDSPSTALSYQCYLPHVAEGVNQTANNEIRCMNESQLVTSESAFIHTVGASGKDAYLLKEKGTSIIWSPRSNISLYGNTAPVTMYKTLGLNIALSTDWTPSGSMNLLRELKCADSFNYNYLAKSFSDKDLWNMVTANPADALKLSDKIGRLQKDMVADIAIYDGSSRTNVYRAIIDADVEHVALALRGGMPLYGDANIMQSIPNGQQRCEPFPGEIKGRQKTVCIEREIGIGFNALQGNNKDSYPLFFSGVPIGEPTCVPSRPNEYTGKKTSADWDGDGIPNEKDNCPYIFNPIRPMDNGVQADCNKDGIGDVCDPKPCS